MIRLRVDYSKNVAHAYAIFATFTYNPRYVAIFKSMKKRFFHSNTKEWEVGYDCYTELISTLNREGIPYNYQEFMQSIEDLKSRVQKSKAIQETNKEIDTSILNGVDFKTKPRNYQMEGIAYGLENDKFLLADEQGLGKSLQCLNIARLKRGGQHCLIIVGYNALQFNWVEEVKKHTNEEAYVLGQRELKSGKRKGSLRVGSMQERMQDLKNLKDIEPFFIITSVVTLREHIKEKYTDSKGNEKTKINYIFADEMEKLCNEGVIGRVIVDESQVCKNHTSKQSEALLRIKSAKYKIAATGTPLMNKHIDLYPLMCWLDRENCNYWAFRDTYCILGGFKNKDIIGNKNADLLNNKLSQFMLRRKKDDVLDLPEKIFITEVLEMDLKQAVLYDKIKKLTKMEVAKMKGNKVAILSSLIKLRQVTCHPSWIDEKYKDSVKFERILQLMNEINENGNKAIIFSNWATPIEKLYDELALYNPALITGATKDRMEQVNKFQNDDSCKVILGTIGAMGTGLTLTAASNVIFLDEPWNRALKDQATDRAHRIGTKNNVNVYTLICKNTIDEMVHRTVVQKGLVADEVVDGITMEEIDEILN